MNKEIYFFVDEYPATKMFPVYCTWQSVEDEINKNNSLIYTTDLAHLSFDLIDRGYDIYVVKNGITKRFYPGMDCCIGKDIKREHNILRLLLGGTFNDDFKNNETL